MEEKQSEAKGASRRTVLAGAVSGLGSIWLTTHWTGILAAEEHAHTLAKSGRPATFAFFSRDEAAEIEAVAAQIIPAGDTPGAREAGTIYFIDRILTTFEREKQATYTQGLRDLRAKTQELFPDVGKFSDLTSSQQVQVLEAIEKTAFFSQVRQHTIVGFFANPEYSGNQDKVGWNLIGFEDKFDWQPPFGRYDSDEHQQG